MSKRYLALVLSFLSVLLADAQEIQRMEYFFNDDPGFGAAIPLDITQADRIETAFTLSPNGLESGMHQLFIRVRDEAGHWSMTTSRIFFIDPIPAESVYLQGLEYFIDTDPGFGNGTPINVENQSNIALDLSADLADSNMDFGFHQLYIRARDNQGRWSHTTKRIFYLQPGTPGLAKITRLEYYLASGEFVSELQQYLIPEPATTVDLDFQADLSFLPSENKMYQMSIYAVNEMGVRSLVETRPVNICDGEPAKAGFEFTIAEGRIDLSNTSTSANTFHWIIGEEIVEEKDRFFEFEGPGRYPVSLVAANICNQDTLSQVIEVPGLLDVFPNTGSIQQNEANLTITGFGLDSLPQVMLEDEGGNTYFPVSLLRADTMRLRAVFDFSQMPLGGYMVQVANESSGDTLSLGRSFTLLEGGTMPYDQWVEFELAPDSTFRQTVLIPDSEKMLITMKKADRIGYSGTWRGELSLYLGEELLGKAQGSPDLELEIEEPLSTLYTVEVPNTTRRPITGKVKVSFAPDWLPLNEWTTGEILRPYGYDWKYVDIGSNVDTLFFETEGYGLWSTIEVFQESITEPVESWTFSNMGAGYAIKGHVLSPESGRYYIRYKDSAVLQKTENGNQLRDYLIYAGSSASDPVDDELRISGISNTNIGKDQSTLSLKGNGFSLNDTIYLENNGVEVLIFPEWVDEDGRELSFKYNFSNISSGNWNLKIKNGNKEAYLNEELTIYDNSEIDLWAEIVGRDKLRIGRKQKFIIKYGNRGNVDSYENVLYLKVPKNVVDTIGVQNDLYYVEESDDFYRDINYIFIPSIPGNTDHSFEITLYSKQLDSFEIEVGYLDRPKEDNLENQNSRVKKTTESDILIECLEKPNYGDIVFSYFGLKTSYFKHVGILGYKEDPDGKVRDYVFELYRDGHVYARRWVFSEAEELNYRVDFEQVKNGLKTKEQFRKDWAKIGVNIDDPAYKGGLLKNYKEKNGDGFFIGYARLGSNPRESNLTRLNDLLNQNFEKFNAVNGKPYVDYTIISSLFLDYDEKGHCGSFVLDNTVSSGFGSLIEGDNPSAYPYKMVENMESYGLLCRETEKDKEEGEILLVPMENDSTLIQLDNESDSTRILKSRKEIEAISSVTPEDKYGPTGFDQETDGDLANRKRFIPQGQLFEYKIDYWNKEDATAPAAEVFIRDTLDTNFDISTVNFTEIGFLGWKVPLEGGQYFNVTVDMRPEKELLVNVEGTVNPESREIYWVHRSLDPETMELPEDPTAGYLPPIDSTGYNIGWVMFTVEGLDSLGHNSTFQNQAHVNFDGVGPWGPAPPYGPYTNTIDQVAPESNVMALPERSGPEFTVQWQATDEGAGVEAYDIFVREDDGDFKAWLQATSLEEADFTGEIGRRYAFYSVATDHAGNQETKTDTIESNTYVPNLPGITSLVSPLEYVVSAEKFIWMSADEADRYTLQVAADSLFKEILVEEMLSDTSIRSGQVEANKTHFWRVRASNVSGDGDWSEPGVFEVDIVTSLESTDSHNPENYSFGNLYPNPSEGVIFFEFAIPVKTKVRVELFGVSGSSARVLIDQELDPGTYNLRSDLGMEASGLYILQMWAGNFTEAHRLIINK
ncbi:Por secretion system C-terminal sorting domain-containing protein [Cyclobacterium lianum]|uniref:Por secretion system C-terminal sorting domain-containing protein n=1 Tax=Cyclobacterium lianum TaxID=388280 RepID=A0A1M7I367_9BACT|nr:T9SS type A sorting domain-containing protein [Cyclobacterium lianum]SHM35108.1 Por secretion system C-terminal sorting domain-containing protein [Cyclobacterium lianum]